MGRKTKLTLDGTMFEQIYESTHLASVNHALYPLLAENRPGPVFHLDVLSCRSSSSASSDCTTPLAGFTVRKESTRASNSDATGGMRCVGASKISAISLPRHGWVVSISTG